MKKCTWKKYTASVLVAAMLAAQPMAVYADEASTASQAAYSDTEAKDINGVYERVSDKVAGMLANGELTYSETSGYLYNASGSKVRPGERVLRSLIRQRLRQRHRRLRQRHRRPRQRHRIQQRLRQRLQRHQLLRLRQSPRQEQGNQRQNPRQRQQILKPVQQRQKQQRQDPKQNQNLRSETAPSETTTPSGSSSDNASGHRQIQKQRSLRQLQRQAAVLSRMFPTRHPVFSRSVIEYSIM